MKTKKIFQIYSLLLLLVLTACIPTSPKSNRRSTASGSAGSTDAPDTSNENIDFGGRRLYWTASGIDVEGTATINGNTSEVIYIRGEAIHTYLSNYEDGAYNYDRAFCFVASYNTSSVRKHIRARAIPIDFYNFTLQKKERLLRVDLPKEAENKSLCQGIVSQRDQFANSISQVNSTIFNPGPPVGDGKERDVAFSPSYFCSGSCNSKYTAENISLYRTNGLSISDADYIPSSKLDISPINLRVDLGNSTVDPVNQCDIASCQAKGFDCCLDGQCVNDGSIRPNASSEANYSQAISDVLLNSLAYVNYPNVFYICSNVPVPTPSPTPYVDPDEAAQAQFEKDKREYLCLEEGKKEFPDFGVGECSDGISINRTACTNAGQTWTHYCQIGICSNLNYHSKFDCEANSETWTADYTNAENANGTQIAHDTIRSDVWDRCGCEANPFPTNPDEPQCPDFGLKATKDASGNILSVSCLIPPASTEPTPFQNLSISVPARSAPHRFIADDGTFYDELGPLQGQDIKQEGEAFSYLDEFGKTDPVNGDFNMNSILGSMTIELNRTVPAKMINLNFDQTYVISTTTGFYTPCPSCANDSWFEPFKAFPPSQGGNGLRAIGFITNRESFSNNLTLGNYEDTKFGRACWLPPTMIPLTHQKQNNIDNQRRDRLTTQAALWINGYQKDWYGFNQGALIGSFDGVSWFAVGSGRRVVATSNKLFLAINAPFADLAEPSAMIVSVVQDSGQNIVSDHDFDPELSINHPEQNQGATCQFFHQCDVDSDCITKLGWEYVCSDVTEFRTRWPKFDIEGTEIVDQEMDNIGFDQILHNFKMGANPRRCVYRGQGAVCRTNWSGESAIGQKNLRCAPNFYCSNLTDSTFNDEVARSPNFLELIFYGQEADFLGRPKNYLGGNATLPEAVRDNILYNSAVLSSNNGVPLGICRPGKRLTNIVTDGDFQTMHGQRDIANRTDYISQISSCDSTADGLLRGITCPVIQEEEDKDIAVGELVWEIDDTNAITDYTASANFQNMCGGEAKYSPSPGIFDNTFEQIEAEPLPSILNILFPKVARDACLRKAGSVCHTDLDCGPNRLHAGQALFIGPLQFGNTDAENKFWQEELICGQSTPTPDINSDEFGQYDITKNRCCREIGKDITMFTQYSRADTTNIQAGDPQIVESILNGNEDLRVTRTPASGAGTTSAVGRYSRYGTVNVVDDNPPSTTSPINQAPLIEYDSVGGTPQTARAFQWKTINDTGRRSCCGAGWIRKFADGTNDWSNRQRLNFDYTNLSCIHYRSEAHEEKPPGIKQFNYDADRDVLCFYPHDHGCIQYPLDIEETAILSAPVGSGFIYQSRDEDAFTVSLPQEIPYSQYAAALDTNPVRDTENGGFLIGPNSGLVLEYSHWTWYAPRFFPTPQAYADPDHGIILNRNADSYATSFYLPVYMQKDNINLASVTITYYDSQGTQVGGIQTASEKVGPCIVHNNAAAPGGAPLNPNNLGPGEFCINQGEYCLVGGVPDDGTGGINSQATCTGAGGTWVNPGFDVFHIQADRDFNPPDNWTTAGFRIEYTPINTSQYEACAQGGVLVDLNQDDCPVADWDQINNHIGAGNIDNIKPIYPGNDNFYMTKLGRLELLGIPQIVYEPIYCSSNREKLVPGIFDGPLTDRTSFNANSFSYDPLLNLSSIDHIYSGRSTATGDVHNGTDNVVYKDKIALPDIFSENEFKCCRELGLVTDSASNCCSGYASANGGTLTCSLPQGANLNVYFNKFVSGEGMSEYIQDIDEDLILTDNDFIPETGEPKFNSTVYAKLTGLGILFCENNEVRSGAASGEFAAQPNSGFTGTNSPDSADPENALYRSLIDSNLDFDQTNDTGAFRYMEGFRWGHQIYCN